MKTRILGIDPGTSRMGFGIIEIDKISTNLVDAGVITTSVNQSDSLRLKIIYDDLAEIITANQPTVISVEKLFFAKNVTNAMTVSQARGVVLLLAEMHGLVLYEFTPLQIKQALTGYGRAQKHQIQSMVKVMLGLKNIPKPDDCADALAAALVCAKTQKFI